MRIPIVPLLALGGVALILTATLYDLVMIAGRALIPWFGWMLP